MVISAPCPSWSVLLRRIVTRSPSGVSTRSSDLQRHQLGPAERAGEAQRQQRAVPLAGERVGAQCQHLLRHVGGGRRLGCLALPIAPLQAVPSGFGPAENGGNGRVMPP